MPGFTAAYGPSGPTPRERADVSPSRVPTPSQPRPGRPRPRVPPPTGGTRPGRDGPSPRHRQHAGDPRAEVGYVAEIEPSVAHKATQRDGGGSWWSAVAPGEGRHRSARRDSASSSGPDTPLPYARFSAFSEEAFLQRGPIAGPVGQPGKSPRWPMKRRVNDHRFQ